MAKKTRAAYLKSPFNSGEAVDIGNLPDTVRLVADWSIDAPNPLIVVGPNSSGKTVLLSSIAVVAQRSGPKKQIVYIGGPPVFGVRKLPNVYCGSINLSRQSVALEQFDGQNTDLLFLDGIFDGPYPESFAEDSRRQLVRQINRLVQLGVRVVVSVADGDGVVDTRNFLSGLNGPRAAIFGLGQKQFLDRYNGSSLEQIHSVEIEDLPKQSVIAPQFDYSGDGPITIAREPAPTVTVEKTELYEELRLKANNLLDACPKDRNRTAQLRGAVNLLVEFLPDNLFDIQPRRLWSRANTLRRHRDADLRVRRSKDPDGAPLPELVAELLSDLVEQFNVFALHDEVLRQQDAASLGPRDRAEVLVELEAGRVLSGALADDPGLVADSAKSILQEAEQQGSDAATQEGINADQAIAQALDTQRNGAIALVAKAIGELKKKWKSVEDGGLKYVGSEGAKLIFAGFVRLYEGPISTLLGQLHGGDAVAYVLRLLRQISGG